MKKLKFTTLILFVALMPLLVSCLDDDEPESTLVISTIKVPNADSKAFYFLLDNGKKMYPGINNLGGSYELKDGQRAFVLFQELEEQQPGYDYNIEVEQIENVLTKDIVDLDDNNKNTIGDDKINATYMWIAQGYLTIEFQVLNNYSNENKHTLNLVVNKLTPPKANGAEEDEYINLEFRHNDNDDSNNNSNSISGDLQEGYVSFKLDKIADQIKTKKGLKIRVKTIYDNEKYITVNF